MKPQPGKPMPSVVPKVLGSQNPEDLREYIRHSISGPVEMLAGHNVLRGQMINISAGGILMRFPAHTPAPVRSPALISAPRLRIVQAPGVIVRAIRSESGCDLAVSFEDRVRHEIDRRIQEFTARP